MERIGDKMASIKEYFERIHIIITIFGYHQDESRLIKTHKEWMVITGNL